MKKVFLMVIALIIIAGSVYAQCPNPRPGCSEWNGDMNINNGDLTVSGDVEVTGDFDVDGDFNVLKDSPLLVIGNNVSAEDIQINFLGHTGSVNSNYYYGVDGSDGSLTWGIGTTMGTTELLRLVQSATPQLILGNASSGNITFRYDVDVSDANLCFHGADNAFRITIGSGCTSAVAVLEVDQNKNVLFYENVLIQELNFAADGEASDTYVVTLAPAPTAYKTGMMVIFTATTANTDGATLDVNGLDGNKTILKMNDQALVTGDIEAGQVVVVVYDGTNFQMTSQVAQ